MRITRRAIAVVMLGGLIVASCGSDDDGASDDASTEDTAAAEDTAATEDTEATDGTDAAAGGELEGGEGEVSIIAWAGYIERGEIRPVVAKTFPLTDIVAAQQEFLEKAHVGKFVLIP